VHAKEVSRVPQACVVSVVRSSGPDAIITACQVNAQDREIILTPIVQSFNGNNLFLLISEWTLLGIFNHDSRKCRPTFDENQTPQFRSESVDTRKGTVVLTSWTC